MAKKVLWLGVAVVGIFVLSGCATVNKKDELLNQELRNKITVLETQLSEKDNEINSLKESMANSGPEVNLDTDEARRIDVKKIQTALKNAGYFQNVVDGKNGRKTRQAVREFQKANNLYADGKVGKNTWMVLKEYLDKKVK